MDAMGFIKKTKLYAIPQSYCKKLYPPQDVEVCALLWILCRHVILFSFCDGVEASCFFIVEVWGAESPKDGRDPVGHRKPKTMAGGYMEDGTPT